MKSILFKLSILLLLTLSYACKKEEEHALDSLEGEWDVVTIYSNYGIRTEGDTGGRFETIEDVMDSGELGTFHFKRDLVDFEFTRNDTLYAGSETWRLDHKKVTDGFHRVSRYTLTIENQFLFNVRFGDSTSDAHKNATEVTFMQSSTTEGYVVNFTMSLKKR